MQKIAWKYERCFVEYECYNESHLHGYFTKYWNLNNAYSIYYIVANCISYISLCGRIKFSSNWWKWIFIGTRALFSYNLFYFFQNVNIDFKRNFVKICRIEMRNIYLEKSSKLPSRILFSFLSHFHFCVMVTFLRHTEVSGRYAGITILYFL